MKAGKRRPHSALAALCAALLLVLTACTGLPHRGAVTVVEHTQAPDGGVILDAAGPAKGANPNELLQGFLRACAAGVADDFRVARQYLTPEAAARWNPATKVSIYPDSSAVEYSQRADGALLVSVPAVGSVNERGVYTAASQDAVLSHEFSLMRNREGQWRIAALEDTVMLAQAVFTSLYVRAPLYFYNGAHSVFVPDLRWYPRARALTMMSNDLLTEPSPWLAPAAHPIFLPKERQAAVSVTMSDTTAVVELPAGAAGLSNQQRMWLQEQFEKTLIGSGLAHGVELRVQGATISIEQKLDTQSYPYVTAPLVAVQNDALVSIQEGKVNTLLEAGSFPAADYAQIAVDYAAPAQWVVGVSKAGTALSRLAPAQNESTVLLRGTQLAQPSIDRYGWAWTISAANAGKIVAVNVQTGDVVTLAAPDLAGVRATKVAVSREGERIVIGGSSGASGDVWAYGIERTESGAPLAVGEGFDCGQGFTNVHDLAWLSETKILVLGQNVADNADSLYTLDLGGQREPVRGVTQVQSVTAGRGTDSIMAVDKTGGLHGYSGLSWADLAAGVQTAAYPG